MDIITIFRHALYSRVQNAKKATGLTAVANKLVKVFCGKKRMFVRQKLIYKNSLYFCFYAQFVFAEAFFTAMKIVNISRYAFKEYLSIIA